MTTTPTTPTTTSARSSGTATGDGGRLLRLALRLDAAASGTLGVLALAAAPVLDDRLGIGTGVLRGSGAFLLAYAAGLLALAALRSLPRPLALTVVVGNVGWALATAYLGLVVHDLPGLGTAVVLGQAVAVLGFADLQWLGLRRAGRGSVPARR